MSRHFNNQERKPWSAWRWDDQSVRVQINEPSIAAAFAKIKGVVPTGYSVQGGYLRLYRISENVDWVNDWMRAFIKRNTGTKPAKENKSQTVEAAV